MIINISSPLKKNEIKELLLSSENPKYTFIKDKNRMEMQFEVTFAEGSEGDPIQITKGIIKSAPWGKVLNIRVIEEGKTYTWS